MVLPFPNEIWLDIFHGLAKEGEYDTLERCRVVCRGFHWMAEECLLRSMVFKSTDEVERIKVEASGGEMRRWRGPTYVHIEGGNGINKHQPIPHLATFASRLGGRWIRVKELRISFAVWRARNLDADAVFRDLARFPSVTDLGLSNVILPAILTLGRLVCALPCLQKLGLFNVEFIQQPFEASTVSQFRLLPRTQLETLSLGMAYDGSVPTPDFVELANFIAAVSNRIRLAPICDLAQAYLWSAVRTLHLSSIVFPSVATFARLLCALPSLEGLYFEWSCMFVKHGFDLRSTPVHPGLPPRLATLYLDFSTGVDLHSIADLVDVFITTGVSHKLQDIKICPSPSLQLMSESDVCLNRLVRHSGQSLHRLNLGAPATWRIPDNKYVWLAADQSADWATLMAGLLQIDTVLSWPVFKNLVHVSIHVIIFDTSDVGDEERVDELRACLPKLDGRGILGMELNDTRVGVHWDDKTGCWKRYGIERGAAQGTVITEEVSMADGGTCASPCGDSEAVPAALGIVSVPAAARANAQPLSSSYPIDSRVVAEECNDGIAPQNAVAALETCSGILQQMSSVCLPAYAR
ncbi:hypothetical protein POSPLADRAFT_1131995 [Postia placenta MAD-698-R-SB12]|uniref:F-box domain-containing protein n=1 Tax=Postia placenta MAD-698-R-SB12 TaxID=670580 RepID=A0A1X6NAT2_9APHY|nr:hypothetical protein POSPLADRAFT_1131995 [Postia placenta MAD-698-R-SB12]OSX65749.1 hypothetical protein POSPLADRAFT_1131995 [Postia placenta MAD-698-R-SB12]